ncbi:MAG: aminopeptidase P family protein [Oscillospiraceae bacterium]|nr:aminopeptidase P family protein [Oscillospiraceae bacterium]
MIKQRIEKIRQKLKEQKEASAFIMVAAQNRRYMTNIPTSSGYLIITPENGYFFTDSRYIEFAKKSLGEHYSVELYPKNQDSKKHYGDLLKLENIKNILYEENYIYLKTKKTLDELFCGFALLESGGILEKMREIKDASEIENIKKAQNITDSAFSHILNQISSNMNNITETDIAAELEYFMKKNGSGTLAFEIIAVSGKKSSYPHGQPENVKLSKGFLTMDFGAVYGGYCSDMTRTICLGKPTAKMLEVYNTVKTAQSAALSAIKAGAEGASVDRAARGIINDAGYKNNFGHGLGHSVGLEIHESPNFPKYDDEKKPGENEKEKMILSKNTVMTVEPGIYLENEFGVRIEDLVVVTKEGCLNLTKSGKELIEI